MSGSVGAYSYDIAVADNMPASRTRGTSFVRPGINSFGVVLTGYGGQQFTLTIESYFTLYDDAVAWGTAVQSLQKTFGTIVTPRGSWPLCFFDDVSAPKIKKGLPNTPVRIQIRGRVP